MFVMTQPGRDPQVTSIQYMDDDGRITAEQTPDSVTGVAEVTNPDGTQTIARLVGPLTGPSKKITKVSLRKPEPPR